MSQVRKRLTLNVMMGFILLIALASGAACGTGAAAQGQTSANPSPTDADPPTNGHVTIQAEDFSFDMPSSVPAGSIEFTFVNLGDEVHQAQFFHLKPPATADQFIAQLKAGGPASTRTLAVPWGGMDEVAPHKPVKVIITMAPGAYVVACLVRGADGMFHYQMGMTASFSVPPVSGTTPPYTAADDGTATLLDAPMMSITLPPAISQPGAHLIKVVNSGTQVHALDILQLAPGATAADVQAYFNAPSGQPPFVLLGGVGGAAPAPAPHPTQWLFTHLAPGDYVAACLVVDPVTHKPHAAAGMLTPFTVAA